jgi:aspartate/methionine/tyrosine aminotransferase
LKLKPFRLERYFAKYEFSAPYLLCCSDCESFSIGEILDFENGTEESLLSLCLGYTESQGSPELRDQIALLYNGISSENVLVHSGAEEAIFNFMNVTLNADDHVIVHSPHYQSLGDIARSLGAHVTEWQGDSGKDWQLDLNFLEDSLTERTKLLVVNFPHNPTGYLPDKDLLADLSMLSNKYRFIVFSDEVYRFLEYRETDRLPAFCELDERAVSLGVMSKSFGLAGLRIGWVVTRNKDIFKEMALFKDYTTICNSAPSEYLATVALRNREPILTRNLEIIRNNLKSLNVFFSKHSDLFQWSPPKAGPIACPRYLGGSVDEFCHRLVTNKGVLLLPGNLYHEKYDFFRIGFGRKNMMKCLKKLAEFIEDSRNLGMNTD